MSTATAPHVQKIIDIAADCGVVLTSEEISAATIAALVDTHQASGAEWMVCSPARRRLGDALQLQSERFACLAAARRFAKHPGIVAKETAKADAAKAAILAL